MRNKHVYKPSEHEITCCSVQITLKEQYLKEFDFAKDPREVKVSEEAKNHLFNPSKVAEKFDGYVGITVQIPYLYVLFRFEKQDDAVKFYEEIKNDYETKLVKNVCYADSRYLEGAFKGKVTTLPPDYVDKAIRDLLDKYCIGEIKIEEDYKTDSFEYVGDLGGREARIFIGGGHKMMTCGLKDGTAITTANVCGAYQQVLRRFEKEIIEWRETHQGCCKKL